MRRNRHSAPVYVPGKLDTWFGLDGYCFPASGLWEARDATLASWPGQVGPTLTQTPLWAWPFVTGLPPIPGESAPYRVTNTAVEFTDGYAFAAMGNTAFGNIGAHSDIIVEAVFKFQHYNSNQGGDVICSKFDVGGAGGWLLWSKPGNLLTWSNASVAASVATVLPDNSWHHALIVNSRVSNSNNGTMVLDGYLTAAITSATTNDDSTVPFMIGGKGINGNYYPSDIIIGRIAIWTGSLGYVPTPTSITSCAAARYAALTRGT